MSKTSYTKEAIIARKTSLEAGYVNNPNDRGGETNHGITIAVARQYGFTGNMRDLPRSTALEIYDKLYWGKMKLDDVHAIDPLLADRMLDFGINAGTGVPVKWLQRILNVLNNQQKQWPDITADGAMGPRTLNAIRSLVQRRGNEGLQNLLMALISCQINHYIIISENREANETFTYGWLNRVRAELGGYFDTIRG